VQFFSLQKDEYPEQAIMPSFELWDWTRDLHDWADTAALIANLDLIVSVDTGVVHLAGALGKPVWILSRFEGCWRWLENRDDSPWYPSARLFRQKETGDWDEVLDRVSAALKELL
jgi:ADP-heptose:LPS heptosyltransferase